MLLVKMSLLLTIYYFQQGQREMYMNTQQMR